MSAEGSVGALVQTRSGSGAQGRRHKLNFAMELTRGDAISARLARRYSGCPRDSRGLAEIGVRVVAPSGPDQWPPQREAAVRL